MATKWAKQITPSLVERLMSAEKNLNRAISVFESATAEYANGFRHDHATFGLMIRRLLSANKFVSAEEMLDRMKQEKCSVNEDIFLSIYRAYGRVHKPLEAVRVFKKMKEYECQPTARSYVTVFSILVDESHLKMAFEFYRYMRKQGVPASVVSLNVLIKALCKSSGTMDSAFEIFKEMPKRGFAPDSYTYGTLINGLCRGGRTLEAKELLVEMEANACAPSVFTYSCLIHGLCQSKKLDDAMELFKEMKVDPNVYTYTSLIDGLCKSGHSLQAISLLERMARKRLTPNSITYSSLIHGLCKEGKVREAVEMLDKMKLQGLKPDAGLYSKVINGFCEAGKFQEAANFLDEMALSGITPNRVTWGLHVRIHNRVVQGLCTSSSSNQSRALPLYRGLRSRGVSVEAGTFGSLIRWCCKKGDLHEAARVLEEMVVDGCVPDEEIWKAMLLGLWDRRNVREASEVLKAKLMDELHSI